MDIKLAWKIKVVVSICFANCFLIGTALSQSLSTTHTEVVLNSNTMEVYLDLPWTLVEAVQLEFPSLNAGSDESEFRQFTERYITKHFLVKNHGIKLAPGVLEWKTGIHSHSHIVLLEFPFTNWEALEIENTILFNRFENQQNIHEITLENGQVKQFETSKDRPSFKLNQEKQPEKKSSSWMLIVWSIGIMLFLVFWMLIRQRRLKRDFDS